MASSRMTLPSRNIIVLFKHVLHDPQVNSPNGMKRCQCVLTIVMAKRRQQTLFL